MLVLIDYGLIVVFFAVLFILVLIVGQQRPEAATSQETAASGPIASFQNNKLSYALLGAIFVLLLVVTLLAERGQTQAGST